MVDREYKSSSSCAGWHTTCNWARGNEMPPKHLRATCAQAGVIGVSPRNEFDVAIRNGDHATLRRPRRRGHIDRLHCSRSWYACGGDSCGCVFLSQCIYLPSRTAAGPRAISLAVFRLRDHNVSMSCCCSGSCRNKEGKLEIQHSPTLSLLMYAMIA